jgi:hypothetical protein
LRLSKIIFAVVLLLASVGSIFADATDSAASAALLPARLGNFRQVSTHDGLYSLMPKLFFSKPEANEAADFVGKNGKKVVVEIIRFRQDTEAYEFLSLLAHHRGYPVTRYETNMQHGTAGYIGENEIGFFKGRHFVRVSALKPLDPATRDALVPALTANLDNGEGDIPPLVKHLPNAEEAQKTAIFLHSFSDFSELGLKSDVLSAIDAGRNADTVFATYGPSKLVIIEFNTPQLAADNDRRIIARIQELWKLGQPAPTAYRRVGNYSVFVFDAPDEQTAKQLIDQVKYEQVVQWLGDNPNILKEAQRRYVDTTLGVLVTVLKASGYALITCLGMGGLIGGLLFGYRRSQQRAATAYSDAGGMLRLNLDELTPETDSGRLLQERN